MSLASDKENAINYLNDSYDQKSRIDEIQEPIIAKPTDSQIAAAEEELSMWLFFLFTPKVPGAGLNPNLNKDPSREVSSPWSLLQLERV